jgi:hypothetical protein
MKVRQADLGDHGRGETSETELPLSALSWVKQDAVLVPSQKVAVVVTFPGGRLARGAEYVKFSDRHVPCLSAPGRITSSAWSLRRR